MTTRYSLVDDPIGMTVVIVYAILLLYCAYAIIKEWRDMG